MTMQQRQGKNCKVAEPMLSTKVQQRYTAQDVSLGDQDQQSKRRMFSELIPISRDCHDWLSKRDTFLFTNTVHEVF